MKAPQAPQQSFSGTAPEIFLPVEVADGKACRMVWALKRSEG